MEYLNDEAFNKIQQNLKDIPTDITSEINIKQLLRELEDRLKSDLRRRSSYV